MSNQLIPFYNLFIGIGIIAGYKCFEKNELLHNINEEYLRRNQEWIIIGLLISSFLGAAIFENLYHKDFSRIGKYGITFYGGLITGIVLAFGLLKFNRVRFKLMLNLAVPSILLAHAFGRIGCFCAGCCYGKYFNEVGIETSILKNIRIPTQLIESSVLFGGFVIVNKWITFEQRYLFYLTYYPLCRFSIECYRADERGGLLLNKISPSQVISFSLICIMLISLAIKKIGCLPSTNKRTIV